MRNRITARTIGVVLCFVFLWPLVSWEAAWAREFKGVHFQDQVRIGENVCPLVGIGIRKKFFITVYYGALYLQQPTHDRNEVISSDQPKEIQLHVVYKQIDPGDWVEGWTEGFAENVANPPVELQDKMDRFLMCFDEPVKSGEKIELSYLPGSGTRVVIKGKEKDLIPGRDFMEALWSIWFGKSPASGSLMKGMLGE